MMTGMKVGGNNENSIDGNSYQLYHLWLYLFEQTKKEKVIGRAASKGAAHSIGGKHEKRKTNDRRL